MNRLHDDFCKIPMVVSALEDIQLDLMVKLLGTMITFWLDRDEDYPDNMQMWSPSEELKKYHQDLIPVVRQKSIRRCLMLLFSQSGNNAEIYKKSAK